MKSIVLWLFATRLALAEPIQVTLRVVDENGVPVSGARMTIQCTVLKSAEPNEFNGETNQMGIFSKKIESWSGLYFEAKKSGYYTARIYDQPDQNNLSQEIILQRQIKPRPLFVKFYNGNSNRGLQIPKINQWFDYDLKVGDWVSPYGNGSETDMRLKVSAVDNQGGMQLELSAIDKNAGFMTARYQIKYSELKMPHEAPTTGYQKSVTIINKEDPMDQALFVRSRVKLNTDGEIISAHYGKIQGPVFINNRGGIALTHYFNPSENDTNLEFDPERNLIDDSENPPLLSP